jgi:hypothetical protein
MSPLRTIYRVIVMIAAGVVVVMGWQLYGPPTEKVKAFAVSAIERAQAAWNNSQEQTPPETLAEDPRPQSAPLIASEPGVPGANAAAFATGNEPTAAPELSVSNDAAAPTAATPSTELLAVEQESDRLPQLLAQLEQIGGAKPELGEWGSSGHLYRCSCRAHLSDSPAFVRHFEAVAEEPAAAVEQVVARVEAWRAEQHLSP